jgi:hypothetical protein
MGTAGKARSVNNVGAAIEDWAKKIWIVRRVIFQIGILN